MSPGCKNCYAERAAGRLQRIGQPKYADGFAVREHDYVLDEPYHWRKPRRVFVNSMSDLFHREISADFLTRIWGVMLDNDQHTFQVLTKRENEMVAAIEQLALPMPSNIWLGVSAENQRYADQRIPQLLTVGGAVRFVSVEPMLGPVDLSAYLGQDRLNWVIAGGESGPRARPINEDWVLSLRDQCEQAGVAFFFKQWGGVRKNATGHELDGRDYQEFPSLA